MTTIDPAVPEPVTVECAPPIAVVRMRSMPGNYLTTELQTALRDGFDQVAADESVRVVVLAGLPTVFNAGAAVETLTGPDPGLETFRSLPAVQAPLNCALPVVTAAAGHAIGGGLLLALYADVIVLSQRSRYGMPALSMGFTPCLGATHLVPHRLGNALGSELMLCAKNYSGAELAARGAGVCVVPHDQVESRARELALTIARSPRRSLVAYKRHTVEPTRRVVAELLAQEHELHRETIDYHETKQLISDRYPHARTSPEQSPNSARWGT